MDGLKMAKAIVYFRLLRSVGKFRRVGKGPVFTYCPCSCGRFHGDPIPNGIPEPAADLCLRSVVDEFSGELGVLCQERYGIA